MTPEQLEAHRARFEQRFYAELGLEPLRSGPGYVEAAASDAWQAYQWAIEDGSLQHITEFGEMQARALSHPKSILADSGVIAAPVDHVPEAGEVVAAAPTFPARIWSLLRAVSLETWEDEMGESLVEDADAAMVWIKAAAPAVPAPGVRDIEDHMISALRWLLNITTEFDRKDVRTRQAARLLDDYSTGDKTNREHLEALWCVLAAAPTTPKDAAQPPQQSAQPVGWVRALNGKPDGVLYADRPSLHNYHSDWSAFPVYAAAQPVEVQRVPADPMDWPLPCDVTVGHGTMRKGVSLRTLVLRMKTLYKMATGNDADEVASRTPDLKQVAEFQEMLRNSRPASSEGGAAC